MTTRYKTAKEIMTALLTGKKLRKEAWQPQAYLYLKNEEIVNEGNNETTLGAFDYNYYDDGDFVEWLSPEERWDFKSGDLLLFKQNCTSDFNEQYKVIFVNENVMLCELCGCSLYKLLYNNPEHINKIRKL